MTLNRPGSSVALAHRVYLLCFCLGGVPCGIVRSMMVLARRLPGIPNEA